MKQDNGKTGKKILFSHQGLKPILTQYAFEKSKYPFIHEDFALQIGVHKQPEYNAAHIFLTRITNSSHKLMMTFELIGDYESKLKKFTQNLTNAMRIAQSSNYQGVKNNSYEQKIVDQLKKTYLDDCFLCGEYAKKFNQDQQILAHKNGNSAIKQGGMVPQGGFKKKRSNRGSGIDSDSKEQFKAAYIANIIYSLAEHPLYAGQDGKSVHPITITKVEKNGNSEFKHSFYISDPQSPCYMKEFKVSTAGLENIKADDLKSAHKYNDFSENITPSAGSFMFVESLLKAGMTPLDPEASLKRNVFLYADALYPLLREVEFKDIESGQSYGSTSSRMPIKAPLQKKYIDYLVNQRAIPFNVVNKLINEGKIFGATKFNTKNMTFHNQLGINMPHKDGDTLLDTCQLAYLSLKEGKTKLEKVFNEGASKFNFAYENFGPDLSGRPQPRELVLTEAFLDRLSAQQLYTYLPDQKDVGFVSVMSTSGLWRFIEMYTGIVRHTNDDDISLYGKFSLVNHVYPENAEDLTLSALDKFFGQNKNIVYIDDKSSESQLCLKQLSLVQQLYPERYSITIQGPDFRPQYVKGQNAPNHFMICKSSFKRNQKNFRLRFSLEKKKISSFNMVTKPFDPVHAPGKDEAIKQAFSKLNIDKLVLGLDGDFPAIKHFPDVKALCDIAGVQFGFFKIPNGVECKDLNDISQRLKEQSLGQQVVNPHYGSGQMVEDVMSTVCDPAQAANLLSSYYNNAKIENDEKIKKQTASKRLSSAVTKDAQPSANSDRSRSY
ncbi:hypothetical protein [Photobacterium leiognathi]|uniref:hypothetical protein n=1 Tax=Photobacterium leiognathi TaxID=553611 RepID=UPI0029816ABD|nr:hypothetical protein [Photobacterium leiognathi]